MGTVETSEQLAKLAEHILLRQDAILKTWRRAVQADPDLQTPASLPRFKFNDHIPAVLQTYAETLRAATGAATEAVERKSAEHGAHRWQEGYHLGEVAREWKHLSLCLVDELEAYATAHPDLDPLVMPLARRSLAAVSGEGVSRSVAEYARLQQAAAAGRVKDFELAIEQVNELQRQRAEVLREAAHDLRNSVGVVSTASSLLSRDGVSETARTKSLNTLQTGVGALRDMLNDLLNLARLEAGQEAREVEPFDAGVLLQELCDSLCKLARDRGVFLEPDGPATLPVEGDAAKVRRIAHYLLLNALEHTRQGGVIVSWAQSSDAHWVLNIQDTGPGVEEGAAAPLLHELKAITKGVEPAANATNGSGASTPAAPAFKAHGEGIGLSIVKQLCALLDASLDFQSAPGAGSLFRVTFPLRYEG